MSRVTILSGSKQQQAMKLWMRGCFFAGAAGLLALTVYSARLYRRHRRPLLDVTPERINPNTASIGSLVRLDGIGRARALDIIHYRDHHQQDGPAFALPQDMEHIKGIGPKTAQHISPWLTFESE